MRWDCSSMEAAWEAWFEALPQTDRQLLEARA